MYKRIALNGLAVLALAAGSLAHAETAPGFYAGLGLGQASIDVDAGGFGFDSSDTSFKVFGGYSINQSFGVEVAYMDGGAPDESFGGATLEVESTALNLSAVGSLPLGEAFSIFGKIGFASYDIEVTASSGGQSFSADGGDEEISYGLGVAFNLGQSFGLRAEYEAIDDINFLYAGGVYRF